MRETLELAGMERFTYDPTLAQRLAVTFRALLWHRRQGGRALVMDRAPWPRPIRARRSKWAGKFCVSHIYDLSRHIVILASVSDDDGKEVMRPMPCSFKHAPADPLVTWSYHKTLGDVV